ncbi:helix-turn-helix domain-containing protein [Escherichia coli]
MKHRVLNDIVDWIEECLHKHLDIDVDSVAHKSGYCSRHIQSMFKKEFSITLGCYIRLRRLTKSALLVRLTRKRIFDISFDMRFGSQQAFCRAFTNYFKCTPLEYRNREYFDISELVPALSDRLHSLIFNKELINLSIRNQKITYIDSIIYIQAQENQHLRYKKIMEVLEGNKEAFIVSHLSYKDTMESHIQVESFIGFSAEGCSDNVLTIKNAEYAVCYFKGSWSEYIEFSRKLFINSGLKKRDGFDIEIFRISEDSTEGKILFDVKILIPVMS